MAGHVDDHIRRHQDFARIVRDPKTGQEVMQRQADQFVRLEELDDEIKTGLEKLDRVRNDLDTARADIESLIEDQNLLLKELSRANPERLRFLQR